MRGKRPSSIRKAEAETMVFANSVSAVMRNHEAKEAHLNSVLEGTIEQRDDMVALQRQDQLRALDAVDSLPEGFLNEYMHVFAAVGDLRADSIVDMARGYNKAYDKKEVINERLPGKLHRPVIAMAMSDAVRTGKIEGKGFRGKRKPSRGSLFDVMEEPSKKRR